MGQYTMIIIDNIRERITDLEELKKLTEEQQKEIVELRSNLIALQIATGEYVAPKIFENMILP